MQFRILGPLEIADGHEPIAVDPPKHRALLGVLLLHANELVSSERLIDEIWGDHPPTSAAKIVQTYVSQLRKTIGPDVIVTHPPGYSLRVDDDALDAARFRRLASSARAVGSDGGQEAALLLYEEALGLWRGPPLTDVRFESFARNEVERLEEERLAALIDRIQCELALGRHDTLVPELEALVRQHPLRERLRAQLMLALYRSGRQADALAAYQNARRTLVEQLGLEPSDELQRVERAILQHDAELELRRPGPSATLPACLTSFVGRAKETADLEGLIRSDGVRFVTITGGGGVGKTRLALAVCERVKDSFPDGLFFVSLASVRDATMVPAAIAESVGVVTTPHEAIRDALLRSLEDKKAVLVLDNFEHLLDASELVTELLSRTERVDILATSREPLHVSGEHVFTLGALTESDAMRLFVERAAAARSDFTENDDVPEICRLLDGLPLAIELAAARVNVLSSSQIAARLEKRLALLTGGPRDAPQRQQTLRATIDWSYDLLTPTEQRLFSWFAVFAGGCTLDAAEKICEAELETLASLVDKNLVSRVHGRYVMLKTVREYAADRLVRQGEHDDAMRRLAEYLVALTAGVPAADLVVAPRVLDLAQELDNVRAAVAWTLATGHSELALRLASEAYWFASGNGNLLVEQSHWLDAALASATSVPVPVRAYALTIRAQIAYDLGAYEYANDLAVQSLDLYTAIDDHNGSINTLRGLGTIARARFDDARARSWYEKSLTLATRTSSPRMVSYALKSLADLERDLGNLEEAAGLFERSACLARDTGDRMILTYILHGTGDLAMVSQDPVQAADHYRQSIVLARELGVWRPVVQCVAGLAAVTAAAGDESRAGQLWGAREALERGLGWRMSPHERARYDMVIEACMDAAPLAFQVAAERGRQMTPDDAVQYALDGV